MAEPKIFIECSCLCEILRFEYLKDFDEVSLTIYKRSWFRKKKYLNEIILDRERAKLIMEFLRYFIDIKEESLENKLRDNKEMEMIMNDLLSFLREKQCSISRELLFERATEKGFSLDLTNKTKDMLIDMNILEELHLIKLKEEE